MVDISGINGAASGIASIQPRSASALEDTSREELNTARQAVDDARQVADEAASRSNASSVLPPVTPVGEPASPARDDATVVQPTTTTGTPELTEDTITLSAQAQEAVASTGIGIGQTTADISAPDAPSAPAAGEATAIAEDTRATNQRTRQEDTTAEINGNQNNQSEGARTLGQVVDQFA